MDPDLYQAAAKGDIEPFKKIEKKDELGSMVVTHIENTALHVNIASQTKIIKEGESLSTEFVKEILEMCPSLLLQVNAKGDTPLHVAAKYDYPAIVNVLIEFAKKQPEDEERGVETVRQMLGMTNKELNTALHEAVMCGSLHVVKMLMETAPDFPYSANGSGETPLYLAAARGFEEIVAEILEKCPSPAYQGPSGLTALHAAVKANSTGVTRQLIVKLQNLIGEKDEYGWISLHYAAYLGYFVLVRLLLEFDKAAVFAVDKDRKMTALHMAASQGNYWTVKEIIDHCPECHDLVDDRGWNVLHFGMISFDFQELNDLLHKKYPLLKNLINEKDVKGNTPLHLLAAVSHQDLVTWFDEVDEQAVNKQNISVKHTIRNGYPELKREIQELSKDVGRGQYSKGLVRIEYEKIRAPHLDEDEKIRESRLDEDEKIRASHLDEDKKIRASRLDEDEKRKASRLIEYEKVRASHLVVAALIATVAFAAAFTIPGGYKSENGTAILRRNTAFQAFIITDTIAMILSLSAVFVHFIMSIHSHKDLEDLQVTASIYTTISMGAMVIAFVTGTYAMLSPSLGLAIITCLIGLSFFFFVFFVIKKLNQII